jgi:hypothetical protein
MDLHVAVSGAQGEAASVDSAWLRGAARSTRWVTYALATLIAVTLLAVGGCVAFGVWKSRTEDRCLDRQGIDERPDLSGTCDPTP